jgi:ABC-type multidrug transport system ATPase subunit
MMKISVTEAGKRFNRDWIFRGLNLEFKAGTHYAITGHNGSGKSTLLQCIAGAMHLSEGNIDYKTETETLDKDNWYHHVSICTPYLELIEEMTATEFLDYHSSFKAMKEGWTTARMLNEIGLTKAANKQIRHFSSGMKQRVKLAQAFFSDTSLLLLDEPCSNLDKMGFDLYKKLIENHTQDRLVLIGSNDTLEFESCSEVIRLGV